MIPIQKNIIVVDEQGNEYEATYRKRAKGLVKNGRARFVDENKICLACSPNNNLEGIIMEDANINITSQFSQDEKLIDLSMERECAIKDNKYIKKEFDKKIAKEEGDVKAAGSCGEESTGRLFDQAFGKIFDRIDQIIQARDYICEACEELSHLGEEGAEIKSQAIVQVIQCREATNQQLIKLLEKMCDSLKPNPFIGMAQGHGINDLLNGGNPLPPFSHTVPDIHGEK